MTLLRGSLIQEYYRRIDAGDTAWVLDLFSSDALYLRAGTRFDGKERLRHFFTAERRIIGEHRLDSIWSLADDVICIGLFEGQAADQSPRRIRFSDFWSFGPQGLVVKRQTFLDAGYEVVQ